MKKLLILAILLLTNNNFCSFFGPNDNKSEKAIEVLQQVIKTDGSGVPFSPEIINYCKNTAPSSFTPEMGAIGLAFVGIGATYAFVSNMMAWKPVVNTVVSTTKQVVDVIDKNTKDPASPRTKRAKEEVDTLSIQQLQLLAVTEEQSAPGKTYWKNRYEQALKNQLK